jgi:hypothetical protein
MRENTGPASEWGQTNQRKETTKNQIAIEHEALAQTAKSLEYPNLSA